MKSLIKLLIIVLSSGFFVACSPKLVQVTTETKTEKIKTDPLMSKLDSLNSQKLDFFYGKASTNYQDNKNNLNFKTSIKIQPDSAVNALITFAGLPIVNAIVTTDSVKYQNKRSKCYTENSIDYFRQQFGYPFEYRNVVQILLGLPVAFDLNAFYYQIPDSVYHVIGTFLQNGDSTAQNSDKIALRYYLVNDGNTLEKVEIDSPKDSVHIQVRYGNFITASNGQRFPQLINVKISTLRKDIFIDFAFEHLEVNHKENIKYFVPKSYGICE